MSRFTLVLALGLAALSVQAQAASAPLSSQRSADASQETIVVRDDASVRPPLDTGCVRESGTHLRKRDSKGCTGAPGQSYSRGEIDRSGAIDTGDAIRKLSPRATLSRGR